MNSRLAWAFLERLIPRLASSALMLIFAAMTSPVAMGYYATAVLVLTFLQATFDAAIRQISVELLGSRRGLRFIRRYQWAFTIVGTAAMAGVLAAMSAIAPTQQSAMIWSLAPIIAVPLLIALGTRAVAEFQIQHEWKVLARTQASAVLCSILISLPVLFLTHNTLGPSLQLVLVELVNTSVLRAKAGRLGKRPQSTLGDPAPPLKNFFSASVYSALGWGQTQADRVAITFFAGQNLLGSYSFAWSLSRAVADPISLATSNVIRPQVLQSRTDAEKREAIESNLVKTVVVLCLVVVATAVGSMWVLPLFMSTEWKPALDAAPIMALASIPVAVAWSMTPVLVSNQGLHRALPYKFLGLLLAIPVGIAALHDLSLAAWFALIRELAVTLPLVILGRKSAPLRALKVTILALVILSTLLAGRALL